ncbi:MAG: sigma-70 family RNA polymerase sigma factor [Cyanobacteriota bacterium]|nr:sigma-70 family RNA polymerase sigma factor [Cyanobacteriota bacterium]
MRSRQNIIEIFSTFVQFESDRFQTWVTDFKLRRSMEKSLKQSDRVPASEDFWVLYWHKNWQKTPQSAARAHLLAYLQEACYWVAYKIGTRFVSEQYQLSDYFQMAIVAVNRVLEGFERKRGSSLKDYASIVFRSAIKDTLRQRRETDLCTNWALLRKLSNKRSLESLQHAGFSPEAIARYQLAWRCFKALYAPTQSTRTRQLPTPDRTTWQEITELYNRERISQLSDPGEPIDPETLEKWLAECATQARTYLYPQKMSLDPPGFDAGAGLAVATQSVLEELVAREETQQRQSQQAQIDEALSTAMAQLKPEAREILERYYIEELTQQEIAKQFDIKQYTVSRRLQRARESLLKSLAKWSETTLKVSLSSQTLQQMSEAIEEWLQQMGKESGDREND